MSLSREAVRKWRMGNTKPTRLDDLAKALNVPLRWLKQGGMQHLPADSHLGVKVGKMAMDCREKLMGLTTSIISQHLHDDDADGSGLRELSDKLAREDAQLSRLARQAGGRWLFVSGDLVFAPWVSVEPYQLSRHLWSPEVERIISEELASQRSVYAAWFAVKHRCEDSKLAYPRKITLYKRVRNAQLRAIRFGVNLSTLGC